MLDHLDLAFSLVLREVTKEKGLGAKIARRKRVDRRNPPFEHVPLTVLCLRLCRCSISQYHKGASFFFLLYALLCCFHFGPTGLALLLHNFYEGRSFEKREKRSDGNLCQTPTCSASLVVYYCRRAMEKAKCQLIHSRNGDEVEECHNADVRRWILCSSNAHVLIVSNLFSLSS